MVPDTLFDFMGVWVAAILTLCVYSFLIKDNFMFKLTEAIFVGVSVGYTIVLTYQNGIKPKIQEPLIRYVRNINVDPAEVTNTVTTAIGDLSRAKAGTAVTVAAAESAPFNTNAFVSLVQQTLNRTTIDLSDQRAVASAIQETLAGSDLNLANTRAVLGVTRSILSDYAPVTLARHLWVLYILISLFLGLLFLSRFFPKHAWISRFPMAYLIGIGVGMATPLDFQTRILGQLKATLMPVVFTASGGIVWDMTIGNIVLLVGTLSVLYYFFFSLKKEDPVSRGLTKVGIAYLMLGFGASFAFTIMARVSLLIGRVEFLKEEWVTGTLRYFGLI